MQKIFTGIIAFFCFCTFSFAQNLVPNGGFEEVKKEAYSMMDSGIEFKKSMKFWDTPNLASTDLIGSRFRSPKFKPIPAHNGNNMAGIVIHGDFWSEYVRVILADTLQKGVEYYVEFWMAYNEEYHKDEKKRFLNPYFGAVTDEKFFFKDNKVIEHKPQVFSAAPIELVPNQWVKIKGSFVADKEATHLYIGQFYDPSVNNEILVGYFYIDDVRLEKFSDVSTVYTPKESAPDGLNNIYFETDKYELIGQSFTTLNKVVDYLKKNPSLSIQINGHTDNEGEAYHNMELSNNRAKAVLNYLVQNGVPQSRLSYQGFGSNKPIATNTTEDGRQQNRRVEFLASNALIKNQSLDKVDVAEADLSYNFSTKKNDLTKNQKIGKLKSWNCNEGRYPKSPDKKILVKQKEYLRKDATPYILKRTTDQKFVLFNDSQEHPQTRAYFMSLLEDLYNQGFRHLGVEALDYVDTDLNSRGYPSINTGDRTDEPIYGELLRHAQQLGFQLFPYRAKKAEIEKATRIVARNEHLSKDNHNLTLSAINWAQAMNINRYSQNHPNEKLLVYAHRQNIREKDLEGVRYMGAWLQQFTKEDPLTIEQALMNERCYDNEYPEYYTAKAEQPIVFAKNDKVLVKKEKDTFKKQENIAYDIQVYHPRTKYNDKRPLWFNTFEDKTIFRVNLDKYQMKAPCLVMACHANEDPEIAIPADVIEVKSRNQSPTLMLKPGNYTLILRDKEKRKKLEIVVN